MKKAVIIVLCIIVSLLALSFGGCMAMTNYAVLFSDTEVPKEVIAQAEENAEGVFGDCIVSVNSARVTRDYEGNPTLVVTYNFTNYGTVGETFWSRVTDTCYQNDIGLNEAYTLCNGDSFKEDSCDQKVKNGATILVEKAYVLNDTETDVVVELCDYLSLDYNTYTKTISLSEIE